MCSVPCWIPQHAEHGLTAGMEGIMEIKWVATIVFPVDVRELNEKQNRLLIAAFI